MSSSEIERALAALAIDHNAVSPAIALRLIRDARSTSKDLAELIREELPEADLLSAIAKEMGLRYYDMHARDQEYVIDDRVIGRCDPKVLAEHFALPLVDRTGRIVVAMANPLDVDIIGYLRGKFSEGFTVALVTRAQVSAKLLYLVNDSESENLGNGPQAVPQWVDYLLARAVAEGASDIHLRFLSDKSLMVRFRGDGVLRQLRIPEQFAGRELEVIASIVAKCSTMDATNLREAQDGMFSFAAAGRMIDSRVNVLPQVTGPSLVIRLLDSNSLRKRPEDMGFSPEHLVMMRDAVAAPQGCILVCGPTGSGKTTTLYTLLREVDALSRNVLTVEDPVEYRLPYVGQTQIRNDIGERSLTWGKALRAILRQDPDVILVGEIRDADVAKVAMEASITGHTVLTTTHANDAPGAYLRVVEMGVARYLVADAVSLVLSQRLIRQVHECATMGAPTAEEKEMLARWGVTDAVQVPHATGCHGCNGLGYRGRIAVAEVLVPSTKLKGLIASGALKEEVVKEAHAAGWRPLIHDALRQLREGRTTVGELVRVLNQAASDDGSNEDM